MTNKKDTLNLLQWNARSIKANKALLEEALYRYKVDAPSYQKHGLCHRSNFHFLDTMSSEMTARTDTEAAAT